MTHLLAISVGPVQEFIAAARRTRDLWFGSYLLSEISKAVAKSVRDPHGKPIFPHPDTNLEPDRPEINVANVILAELAAGDPKEVAANAKKAAQDRWRKFAEEARGEASGVIRTDIWADQVGDLIEFYAAWVPRSDDYQHDRARVMRLLAGRKNCRDFEQARLLDTGLPKSSLDGQRETVLQGPKSGEKQATYRNSWPKAIRRKLRARSGEQLDVVGVVKRLGEGVKPYPSVSRIAVDTWIRGIVKRDGKAILDQLAEACAALPHDAVHRLDPSTYPQFKDFPFEGTTLFRTRHHEWWEESEDTPEQPNQRREPPVWYAGLEKQLGRVEVFAAKGGLGKESEPYLAVLVADGDQMGAALSRLASADAHRAFSQALAGFADDARTIANAHNGVLVYAGGDDVLAFVPVDKCLDCARKLHDKFGDVLKGYKSEQGKSLTLSVGLAIGHFMENLEDLLEYGRAAEKAAKQPDRDGLAVHLHKRGGAPIRIRAKWTENPDERLIRYARLMLDEAIPSKLPYDLRNLANLYDSWPTDTVAHALRQDVLRVIRDKQPRSGRQNMPEIEMTLRDRVMDAASLHRYAEELLVARKIATALRQAGDRSTRSTEVAS